jgi:hypothetical protein
MPPGPTPDGPTPEPGPPGGAPRLPTIQGNQRQLREVTDDALRALLACNDPPTDFQRAGVLTRLRVCEDNAAPLLGDFPFEDDASKAHALAALLLPLVRHLIDGPTPMHLLDAPVEGTGKTLLASCVSEVSTGRPVEAIAEAPDDEEWRKRLTVVLVEGPTIVLLDNLNRILDSGALASVLTSRVWKDRVLGVSKTVRIPNLAV